MQPAREKTPLRLDSAPLLERHYVPDEAFMLEALRVVLGLPRLTPSRQEAAN